MPYSFARRNELAREKGWRSYGQQRYWTERQGRRLIGLIDDLCPDFEPERPESLMCADLNYAVNPRSPEEAGLARHRYGGRIRDYWPRTGTWQARLVALHRRVFGNTRVHRRAP